MFHAIPTAVTCQPNEPIEPNRHETARIAMRRLLQRVRAVLSRKRSPERTRRIAEAVAASLEPLRPDANAGDRLTLRWLTGPAETARHSRLLATDSADHVPLIACWQMPNSDTIDSLIALDLNVEVLEEQIETPSFRHPMSPYACG